LIVSISDAGPLRSVVKMKQRRIFFNSATMLNGGSEKQGTAFLENDGSTPNVFTNSHRLPGTIYHLVAAYKLCGLENVLVECRTAKYLPLPMRAFAALTEGTVADLLNRK